MSDEATRKAQMIQSINETIVQTGFANLKMDKIARIMGVSRAKLYQYFSSKEAVVTAVVDRYFQFMDRQKLPASTAPEEFVAAFPETFLQLVTLAASSSSAFRGDLARVMPERSQEFNERYTSWINNIATFIMKGQKLNVFNASVNPELFCVQVEATVTALMTKERLVQYHLDVQSVLADYLGMVITQVVTPNWQSQVDVSLFQNQINDLTQKYQQTLKRM